MKRAFAALLMLLTVTSKADIQVNATDKRVKEILGTLIHRVPSPFLHSNTVIKVQSETADWFTLEQGHPGVVGVYRPYSHELFITTWRMTYDFDEDLTHEYGHFVWFDLLTPKERNLYRFIWGLLKPTFNEGDYRTNSAVEGFAEAFSFYCCRDWREENSIETAFIRSVEFRLQHSTSSTSKS